jgi:hypothetical protein
MSRNPKSGGRTGPCGPRFAGKWIARPGRPSQHVIDLRFPRQRGELFGVRPGNSPACWATSPGEKWIARCAVVSSWRISGSLGRPGAVRRRLATRPAPWVGSPTVTCPSGRRSAPRKRVRGNPPWVQIPPSPPSEEALNSVVIARFKASFVSAWGASGTRTHPGTRLTIMCRLRRAGRAIRFARVCSRAPRLGIFRRLPALLRRRGHGG